MKPTRETSQTSWVLAKKKKFQKKPSELLDTTSSEGAAEANHSRQHCKQQEARRSSLVDVDDCHIEHLSLAQLLCRPAQLRLKCSCTCRAAVPALHRHPPPLHRHGCPLWEGLGVWWPCDGRLSAGVFQVFGEHSTLSVSFVTLINHRALSVPLRLSSLRNNSHLCLHNWQPGLCTFYTFHLWLYRESSNENFGFDIMVTNELWIESTSTVWFLLWNIQGHLQVGLPFRNLFPLLFSAQ